MTRERGVGVKDARREESGMAALRNIAPKLIAKAVLSKLQFLSIDQTGLLSSAVAIRSIARVIATSSCPV